MTTLVRPEGRPEGPAGGRTDVGGHPVKAHAEPSGFAAWRASWAVALRMARRDVRRHKGRSALVVVMVVLPTLLLSALVTVAATSDVSGAEVIPSMMGSGQALLEGPDALMISQEASTTQGYGSGPEQAKPVPGFDASGDAFTNADAVSQLVGAPVVPTSTFLARTTIGDRRVSVDATALDGRAGLGDKLRLLSGRWPEGDRQALVTAHWLSRGLPDSGTVTVTVAGAQHTLDIVGVAAIRELYGSPGLVVSEPLRNGTTSVSGRHAWIVTGDDPVTWSEVLALNEYGFQVTSAAVLRDPPSTAEIPEEARGSAAADNQQLNLVIALGAAMLLITTALLVGPAFAVSAARQRRTLALAASNGASTAVLRRTVLAQALVLGTASAVLGVLLGVAAARGIIAWTMRGGQGIAGPFDIRWGLLAGVALCAVASTLIAALAPARRLGRLDIVGVMRGQSVSPRPSRWVFAAGLLIAGAGGALILWGTGLISTDGGVRYVFGVSPEVFVVAGAVALILGALFLVPMVLAGVGRLGGSLPTSLRIAARDLARHRSRSAPSVAAVLAAVSGLTFGLTGLSSDTVQREREYVAQTIRGEALVQAPTGLLDVAAVRAAAPSLVVSENFAVDTGDPWLRDEEPTAPYRLLFANVVPDGCTPERSVNDLQWIPPNDDEAYLGSPCQVAGTNGYNGMTLTLLPADEIARRLGLDAAQSQAVRDGAAVVRGTRGVDASGTVRIVRGTTLADPTAVEVVDAVQDLEVDQDVRVPVIAMPQTKDSAARMLGASLVLAIDTPTTRDWPTLPTTLTVRDPSGSPISDETAEQLSLALGDDAWVAVEQGFQREDRLVVAILLGVFALLVLVITLTSTALTLAEQQSDQATLAALGATRGTRRAMAAAQAFMLAAVGCLLGVAVGLVPGSAMARLLTSQGWDPLTGASTSDGAILVIPWFSLLIVGVLVPVVAGAIAWAGIRKAPQVTRRAT